MLLLFYLFNGLHWWANLELALANPEASTAYNLIILVVTVIIIAVMLAFGSMVNKQKISHEFYTEKISEQKQRDAEKQLKEAAKAELLARQGM